MANPSFPSTHIAGRVLSTEPLVTFSGTNKAAPLGVMSIAPDWLGGRPGLHLLHHTWTLQDGDADWLGAAVARARNDHPDAHFIMLASNEIEVEHYSGTGESCILASTLCLTDETVFRPIARAREYEFDASYVARLDRLKRHELARLVPRLQLIYGYELDTDREGLRRTRELLPKAHFANHETGTYRLLASGEIVQRLARGRVGLCLSKVEGNMRASMEYLLCGLPVVSTRSKGGRDRYFGTNYCRIVEDDPEAVAAGVAELGQLNLDPHRIRQHVLQIIAFERYNLLAAINGLAKKYLGHEGAIHGIAPLIGAPADALPTAALRARIQTQMRAARSLERVVMRSVVLRDPAYAAVLATARSGTHLLRSILRQNPQLDCLGEVFNPETGEHLPRHFGRYFQREMRFRQPFAMSAEVATEMLDGYFDYLRRTSADRQTIVLDVKEEALRMLDWPVTGLNCVPRLLEQLVHRNFAVIRLKRRNLLSQMASLQLARRTRVWVRASSAEPPAEGSQRITLDVEHLVSQLETKLRTEAQLDSWVGSANLTLLCYEDLVDPRDGTLRHAARRQLEDLLRIPLPMAHVATTRKIAPPLPDLLENFDEVKECLKGTPFEEFLGLQ